MSAVPKLRFPEFDGEWEVFSIGDLGQVITGSTPSTKNNDFYGGDIPFFSPADIPETPAAISKSEKTLTSLGFAKTRRVRKGATLFVCIGSTIGKLAFSKTEGTTNQQINSVVPSDNHEDYFVFSALQRVRERVRDLSATHAVPIINKSSFSSVTVLIPSLPEQQKIASFLSSVDKKIDLLRQKKDALELYKKGLMQKIFSQEIRFKQEDGSDFPEWEEITVGDMAERHVRGLTSSTLHFIENGYPVYGASGVIGYIENYLSEQRYIGVVKDGAGVGRVFEAVEQSSLLSTMESLIPKSGFSFGFVKQVIKDIDFKKFTTGSTIPHVYFKDYSKESYPCPAYEEQERIAHLLDLFDAKIQKASSQIEQLETFKKGLLQQMFV